MKLTLCAAPGQFNDKRKCRPTTQFERDPIELDLQDEEALREFFTSRIHSAWLYDGKRKATNTTALLAVPFDFDESPVTFEDRVEQFSEYAGVVYTSSSDSEEQPKIRVLLALTEPLTDRASFDSVCEWLKAEYPDADDEVFKVSQPLFPCCEFDDGEPTTGYPRFRLRVLTGRQFSFPLEALTYAAPPSERKVKDTGTWEKPPDDKLAQYNKAELDSLLSHYAKHPVKDGSRDKELVRICAKLRQCGRTETEAYAELCQFNAQHVKPPFRETGYDPDDKTIEQVVSRVYGNDIKPPAPEKWPALWKAIGRSGEPDASRIVHAAQLPGRLRSRFKIPEDRKGVAVGVDWVDYENTPNIEPPESLTPFHTVYRGRQNLLWCEDKGGKGTLMTSEIKWLLENTDYRIMVFNSDEPKSDLGARMNRAQVPYMPDRLRVITDVESWTQMAFDVRAFMPNIIYFDALTSILEKLTDDFEPDMGDDTNWARVMNNFESLVTAFDSEDHKIGSLIIHHSQKHQRDREGKRVGKTEYRGNATIGARVTTRIQLKSNRAKRLSELHFKGRHDRAPMLLRYDNFIYVPVDAIEDADQPVTKQVYSSREAEVLRYLIRQGGKPVARPQMARDLKLSSAVLTRIKDKFNIEAVKVGQREQWQPTPEQIKEWRMNGIEGTIWTGPVEGSVHDALSDNEEDEE